MRKVLIILFLALNTILSATNYYVKNGGSDAASGTSDATAWAHHPWMSTWTGHITLVAGDNVFMKRGDTWSISTPSASYMTVGQSGSTGRPITTTAYGTGVKPIIKIATNAYCSVIKGFGKSYITFDNLDIQHYSANFADNNQNGIIIGKDASNNIPHDWIVTNCDIHNIPEVAISGIDDAYNIVIGNISTTSCATTTSYSNQIYNCGYAAIILTGRNPATNRSDFNVYYNYIHDIDNSANVREAYGITFSSNYTDGTGQGYSSGWPAYCIARYNYVANVPGHEGIDCHGGTFIYVLDNYVKNCMTGIILQAANRPRLNTAVLSNSYIERNTIEQPGNHFSSHYNFISLAAENISYRITNILVQGNILFYTSRPSAETSAMGVCIYNADGITVERNKVYNGPVGDAGAGIGLSSSGNSKNVIIRNNRVENWDNSIFLPSNSLDGNIAINNNIVYSHQRPFVAYAGKFISGDNITIYNNTFLTTTTASYPYVIGFNGVTIASGASLIFKNNILGLTSTTASGTYIIAPVSITGAFMCDYNLYWNSSYTVPFKVTGANYNWVNWNAHGYDTHSLNNTNPLFINKSGSYSESFDFALKSTSPAINKGTTVSEVTDDFFGNPRDATPDIGAYEYILQVTGITVTGAAGSDTITTSKGTLQLISSISPSDAANKTVTWNIANGTGQASISSTGIVTAIGNGTVTASATATDGSGVYGTLIITISNQVIPVIVITITGEGGATSIATKNGTLLLIASPANQSVTWSIENDTGQASINSDGLVTAITNGTVTAMATATDGSGVNGTLFITISNQGNADSTNFKGQPVTIYPNPAHEYLNIRIVEQKLIPDFIRIFNLSGKVVLQFKVNPDVTELHIPLNLIEGIYILQLGSGNATMFTQKLIVD